MDRQHEYTMRVPTERDLRLSAHMACPEVTTCKLPCSVVPCSYQVDVQPRHQSARNCLGLVPRRVFFRRMITNRGSEFAGVGTCKVTRYGVTARDVRVTKRLRVLSLFTGAGGLDLGLEAAGFETRLCVEVEKDAQSTVRRNRPSWRMAQPGDIYEHSPASLLSLADLDEGETDLLAGGPPCQPFSKSGYWSGGDSRRLDDPRSATLNAYLGVVEAALPRVLLVENVRGLMFSGKDEGFRLLQSGLEGINERRKTRYRLTALHLNAAHYGVPQFRERVFLVAARSGTTFSSPRATHGAGRGLKRYVTAWDAIGDLDSDVLPGDLMVTGKWADLLPSIPEGENYLWHTPQGGGEPLFGWRTRYWSFLLKLAKKRPSWTIQAVPGPATGPFHWKNRLLSIRELCRLQTFPDNYLIEGDRRSAHRQIGNAVPCTLAEILGSEIRRQLFRSTRRQQAHSNSRQGPCPAAERTKSVPKKYLAMRGKHQAHPGPGLGPGAKATRPGRSAHNKVTLR